MAESPSEIDLESDVSSIDGSRYSIRNDKSIQHRLDSLTQENRVLKAEVDTLKLQIKSLTELNSQLRRESVDIQAKAEQEEEFISNTLLKKITALKKEKENLAINYEQEEECLTNELSKKYSKLKKEKDSLEKSLAQEQEKQISQLQNRIEKLENDVKTKESNLNKLRREKIELENALEQEQESLVHKLWKKMEKLEAEKRFLKEKLENLSNPLSGTSSVNNLEFGCNNNDSLNNSFSMSERPSSTRNSMKNCSVIANFGSEPSSLDASKISQANRSQAMDVDCGDRMGPPETDKSGTPQKHSPEKSTAPINTNTPNLNYSSITRLKTKPDAVSFSAYVQQLREEVVRLRSIVQKNQTETIDRIALFDREHASAEEVNKKLKILLKNEIERRETLSRQLSESESSLEMEDERHFNEANRMSHSRSRTTSDCCNLSENMTFSSYPGPGHAYAVSVGALCKECGQTLLNLTPPGSKVNRRSMVLTNNGIRSRPVSVSNIQTEDLDDDDRAITPPLQNK